MSAITVKSVCWGESHFNWSHLRKWTAAFLFSHNYATLCAFITKEMNALNDVCCGASITNDRCSTHSIKWASFNQSGTTWYCELMQTYHWIVLIRTIELWIARSKSLATFASYNCSIQCSVNMSRWKKRIYCDAECTTVRKNKYFKNVYNCCTFWLMHVCELCSNRDLDFWTNDQKPEKAIIISNDGCTLCNSIYIFEMFDSTFEIKLCDFQCIFCLLFSFFYRSELQLFSVLSW